MTAEAKSSVRPVTPASGGQSNTPAPFLVPAATSLQEKRQRTLKDGDTFAVFDPNGDAIAYPSSSEGLYHLDTRYLSHFFLTIGGLRPLLLSSALREDNATLTCDLTNPDVFGPDGKLLQEHDVIHIRRSRFLWQGASFERLLVRNFDRVRRNVRLEMSFSADFADIFEVRGAVRARRGLLQRARGCGGPRDTELCRLGSAATHDAVVF